MMITSTREMKEIEMANNFQFYMTESVEFLAERLCNEERHASEVSKSRFYRFVPPCDDRPARYVQVLEKTVSNHFDMADCHDFDCKYFWLDDLGSFHEVTVGSVDRPASMGEIDEFYEENPAIMYSWGGSLMANGEKVGSVTFTDH